MSSCLWSLFPAAYWRCGDEHGQLVDLGFLDAAESSYGFHTSEAALWIEVHGEIVPRVARDSGCGCFEVVDTVRAELRGTTNALRLDSTTPNQIRQHQLLP